MARWSCTHSHCPTHCHTYTHTYTYACTHVVTSTRPPSATHSLWPALLSPPVCPPPPGTISHSPSQPPGITAGLQARGTKVTPQALGYTPLRKRACHHSLSGLPPRACCTCFLLRDLLDAAGQRSSPQPTSPVGTVPRLQEGLRAGAGRPQGRVLGLVGPEGPKEPNRQAEAQGQPQPRQLRGVSTQEGDAGQPEKEGPAQGAGPRGPGWRWEEAWAQG